MRKTNRGGLAVTPLASCRYQVREEAPNPRAKTSHNHWTFTANANARSDAPGFRELNRAIVRHNGRHLQREALPRCATVRVPGPLRRRMGVSTDRRQLAFVHG